MSLTIEFVNAFFLTNPFDIAYPGSGTVIYVAQTGAGSRMSSIDWMTSTVTPSSDAADAKHIIYDPSPSGPFLWTDEDAGSSDTHVYFSDLAMNLAGSVNTTQQGNTFGCAFAADNIFTACPNSNTVNQMDRTGLIAHQPSFGGPPVQTSSPIVAALGTVWFINSNNPAGTFQFCNLAGVITQLPATSDAISGMVFDGANFWYCDVTNMVLKQISPAGNPLQTVPLGAIPVGLGFDGTYLWVGTIVPETLQVVDLAGVIQANVAAPSAGTPIFVSSGIPGFTFVSYVGGGNLVAQFRIAGPSPSGAPQTVGTFNGFLATGSIGGGTK